MFYGWIEKSTSRPTRPPESSLKKTIGLRFRRYRAVLSTPQRSTFLYRGRRRGNRRVVAMTAMTAMIKREDTRDTFLGISLAFHGIYYDF